MTRHITAVFTLLLLPFLLAGATFAHGGYVVVDDDPQFGVLGSTFTTIQAAEDSGATYIVVRPGTYTETVVIDTPNVTVEFQGAVITNNGVGVALSIAAEHVTLTGDYCIVGNSDGTVLGNHNNGTGVSIVAPYATVDGLCTRNLTGFDVIAPDAAAHHITVRNCDIRGVATSPTVEQKAYYGILFMGGGSDSLIEDCYVTGKSQAVGLWYGVHRTTVRGVRAESNWGCIDDAPPSTCGKRSAFENYSEGSPNADNTFTENYVDGTRGAAFELADLQENTRVIGNTVRNAWGGAFGAMGSANDYGHNYLIADNVFYGRGDAGDNTNWFSGTGTIRNNIFIDWNNDTTLCTIYLHGDALGDVTLDSNIFEGGGCVLRTAAPSGTLRITNNRFNGVDRNTLWFDGGASDNTVIEGNVFSGAAGRAVSANDTAVTVRNNQIEGVVAVGAGSVVEGNTIHTSAVDFISVYPQDNSIYRYNRFVSDRPSWAEWDANGLLMERNYAEMLNGSPAPLFSCNTNSTCVGNWSAGQVPPP